jgi:hypothetical protein
MAKPRASQSAASRMYPRVSQRRTIAPASRKPSRARSEPKG